MAPLGNSPRSLVFIGFMGAGKTKAVRAAAATLGGEPIDTDELLEAELGTSLEKFFADAGEEEFRRREEAVVLEALARADGAPIALGGGSVLSEGVQAALAETTTVWLDVEFDQAWERVEGSARPLARERGRFEQLLAARRPIYERLANVILPGRREIVKRALPALDALRSLPPQTRMAWGRSASGEYPVYVGRNLMRPPGGGRTPIFDLLAARGVPGTAGSTFVVSDETVTRLYSEAITAEAVIAVEPGEAAKTLAEVERVLSGLVERGMTRSDHLVALGGGVVGDLAGFCAATYQRGVPVIQVPTTLVAQVDSAYGGKTGVDLAAAKNYVGVYHMPAAVIADPGLLASLPASERAAGYVEVLKTGLIAGGELWERVRAITPGQLADPGALEDVIFACARTKLEIVAADERDSGRRAVLNLGHTVGHAIEAASGYSRYRHGEAVGLGLLAALRLSDAEALREELGEILEAHQLPRTIDPEIDTEAILDAVGRDKKRTSAGVGFVLLERPGEPVTGQLVWGDKVREAVEELREGGSR